MRIIYSLLVAFILLGCNKGERELVIVPKGFIGYILIVYDQIDGEDIQYKDNKRVYKVPANGILKTKFSANPGWIGIPEFYYGEIAPENKISFSLDLGSVPVDSVVAYGGIAGSVKKKAGEKEVIRFLEYYIGNIEQINHAKEQAQKLDIIKLIK